MTSSAALLRTYLEVQAELGTDEVILPYPLERQQNAVAAASGTSAASSISSASANSAASVMPGFSGSSASFGNRGASQAASGGPDELEEPGRRAGSSESPAADGIFATLSQAMSLSPGQATAPTAATPRSRPESVSVPAFPDLSAYWEYLAAHPGIAAGDPEAQVILLVKGQGPAGAPLALVGLEPGAADTAAGLAFQGEPGILLAKMLKAIRLDAEACYRTHLVKAARATRATRRDIARLLPWLHAELALAKAPITLLLGEPCAQAVLKTGKPIEELRQEPFRIEGREFAVTYHPAELLAREELKRKAWEDLQWLQKRMAEGA